MSLDANSRNVIPLWYAVYAGAVVGKRNGFASSRSTQQGTITMRVALIVLSNVFALAALGIASVLSLFMDDVLHVDGDAADPGQSESDE